MEGRALAAGLLEVLFLLLALARSVLFIDRSRIFGSGLPANQNRKKGPISEPAFFLFLYEISDDYETIRPFM
uniref:Uncharacterized protein n=1 Tax=Picea sitchensis TaxID=3332 RepID=A0A6B9XTL8_PICSI|nr:hypothetical protein Q903MT_gene5432 [Picea sitchensis]